VPTLKEGGLDAFVHANAWYGAFVPAATPRATVLALEKAFMAAVQQPQVQSQLLRAGLEPTGADGAAAARRLREERDFWRPIVEASGFKSEE
jgi:tripartite-type tricarboxylate transporter receptor subunit TctC